MKIWFACCARNCADRLLRNVEYLLSFAASSEVDDLKIYIAENDSVDNTRDIILHLAEKHTKVVPVLIDSLDGRFSTRESRIAFCRDYLLKRISFDQTDGLYCPVDIDIDLAVHDFAVSFFASCKLVSSDLCGAIFPSSSPYYYDIHALRAGGWCLNSCWKEVREANARGALWKLLVYIRYVSFRQRHYLRLQARISSLIPVASAFGGLGVYSLGRALQLGACYFSPALEQSGLEMCEHVVFNSYFESLYINPDWVISAPPEHIAFRLLTASQMFVRVAKAALSDIKWLALKILPAIVAIPRARHVP